MSDELNKKFNLPAVPTEAKVPAKIDEQGDFETVRRNIADIADIGTDAVRDLADLARSAQHPKAYEVLAVLIKNVVESHKATLEIHKMKKDLEAPDPTQPTTVNNNLIMTTADLDKLLADRAAAKKGD